MSPDASTAIVGAGLAGCLTAIELAKRRIPVQLFDLEDRDPAHESVLVSRD